MHHRPRGGATQCGLLRADVTAPEVIAAVDLLRLIRSDEFSEQWPHRVPRRHADAERPLAAQKLGACSVSVRSAGAVR